MVSIVILLIATMFNINNSDSSSSDSSSSSSQTFKIDSSIAHGFNSFNGKQLFDYTKLSNIGSVVGGCTVATLNDENDIGPAKEVTETTLRSNILSTCPTGRDVPKEFLSIPVADVGTLDTTSTDHTVRIPIKPFNEVRQVNQQTGARIDIDSIFRPTLGDYDKQKATLTIKCNKNKAESVLKFKITKGLPKALYTILEFDLFKPLSNLESFDGFSPVLPNVIQTDDKGKGEIEFKMPFCPYNSCKTLKKCKNGVCPDCVIFYLLAVHWDYCVYGATGAWEGTAKRLPGGTITSFPIWFPVNDDIVKLQKQ